jgi:hypothetical protein
MNEQIEAMKRLGMSDAEIADVLESDKRIDKGEKLFELTAEQKQAEKKAKATGARTVYNFQKRERKADTGKRDLISALVGAVAPLADGEVEVTNIEREFVFTVDGRKYKVVLSAPRS